MESSRFLECQKCKGTGMVEERLYNKGRGVWRYAIIPCLQLACHNGVVNMEEYYKSWEHVPGSLHPV